jgi:hypothetical protein
MTMEETGRESDPVKLTWQTHQDLPPSTFLEGDFNKVMDDQCQFHCDAKHTMRECE